jgi:hypothetical protein
MKTLTVGLAVALTFAAATVPADAKGCIKGAIVGGVAGHYAHRHGFLGAAAGSWSAIIWPSSTRERCKIPRPSKVIDA